jgi:hypothetical protein
MTNAVGEDGRAKAGGNVKPLSSLFGHGWLLAVATRPDCF